MKTKLLLVLALLTWAVTGVAKEKPAADSIITNANVWTVDAAHPTAQAVAVLGERIVAVGTPAEVNLWRGPKTRVIDAGGKLLLPGFNDSHVHFISGGKQLDAIQLNDANSAQEFKRRVAERAKATAKGDWILGGDWDETKWTPAQMPTHELIDDVTPNNPVFVGRYDGHLGLANAVTLRLAGITAATQDPPGGAILRDAQGNPTGILKDAAMNLVGAAIPALTHEQRIKAAKRGLAHAASLGVTSFQNMVEPVSDYEMVFDLETNIVRFDRHFAARWLVEQRSQLQGSRLVRAQNLLQESEREAGVEDVFDDDHVLAFQRVIDVFRKPDLAGGIPSVTELLVGSWAIPVAGNADEVKGRIQLYSPREIRQKNGSAFENAHEDDGFAFEVTGDLRAQFANLVRNLLSGDKDLQFRHGEHLKGTLGSPQKENCGLVRRARRLRPSLRAQYNRRIV